MARVLEEFLHVHRRVANRRSGFRLGHLHGGQQCRLGMHDPHATPAAAARRLDDDWVAYRLGDAFECGCIFWKLAFRTGYAWHTRLDHGLLGRHLVTHDADGLWRGAYELKAALLHTLCEVGVFTQEAVARVNGFGVRDFSGRNDGRHVQIALA